MKSLKYGFSEFLGLVRRKRKKRSLMLPWNWKIRSFENFEKVKNEMRLPISSLISFYTFLSKSHCTSISLHHKFFSENSIRRFDDDEINSVYITVIQFQFITPCFIFPGITFFIH